MTQLTKREREPKSSLLLYHLLKWSLVSPVLHTYFRVKIYGAENVPAKGSFIVVSNHASNLDPPILSSAIGRPVAFMAKEELFKIPILKNLIKLYGAYPVNRTSADRQAIRSAIAALEQGWAIGIFLEGTRTNDAKVNDPKLGAALIAAKFGVGALPVSLWGTEKILKKGSNFPSMVPLTIRIGQIIPPPGSNKKEDLLKFTQDCANSINHLHDLGR